MARSSFPLTVLVGATLLAVGGPPVLAGEPPPPVAALAPAKVPRMQLEKDTVDLGDVSRGGKAEATFEIRNLGDAPLKILSAKPG